MASPASAVANGTSGGSGYEFAVGSAKNRLAQVGGPVSLEVAAFRRIGGPTWGYARGSGDLLAPLPGGDFQVQGEVTCLRVEPKPVVEGPGYRASIKYRFRRTSGSAAPQVGGGVEVFVEDNGRPVNGQPVDGNATGPPLPPQAFEASQPRVCDDPNVAGQPYNPVDQGDYTVRDAR
jgi:hypothetical protein